MYAAILNQRVIDLTEEIRTYPPDADGNQIEVVEATEGVEIGMNYLDGLFYHPSPELTEQEQILQYIRRIDNTTTDIAEKEMVLDVLLGVSDVEQDASS